MKKDCQQAASKIARFAREIAFKLLAFHRGERCFRQSLQHYFANYGRLVSRQDQDRPARRLVPWMGRNDRLGGLSTSLRLHFLEVWDQPSWRPISERLDQARGDA